MDNKIYIATVQKIVPDGEHGPYAVASTEIGLVTFLLEHPVWKEKRQPEEGHIVVLSEITKKPKGWRANSGRFFQPSDEQPLTQRKRRNEK